MTGRKGNCYVTSEALYHLLGGRKAGFVPMVVKHEGESHWYLEQRIKDPRTGNVYVQVLDPTVTQFKTFPDYSKGRGRGFLTKKPSKRARELMKRMIWKDA